VVWDLLYIIVIFAGVAQVVTGLAIWKPVQFSGFVSLLGGLQSARVLHFRGNGYNRRLSDRPRGSRPAGAKDAVGDGDGRSAREARCPRATEPRGMKSPFRPTQCRMLLSSMRTGHSSGLWSGAASSVAASLSVRLSC
jgi:hypothetical protein